MSAATRIQAYLRETARRLYDSVACPPFTAFFHPTEPLVYLNYAIPDEPVADALDEPLAHLRREFRARSRTARFEFVEGFAPHLLGALIASGFRLELRTPLMTCSPTELRAPRGVAGLVVERLSQDSPLADWRARTEVQRRSFGIDDDPMSADADTSRTRYGTDVVLLGRLAGEPVGTAFATAPGDGLSEVAGVGVLEPFRRRGIGAAMTARAAEEAFRAGAQLAFLTPGDEGALRLYERIGFRRAETMLHAVDDAV